MVDEPGAGNSAEQEEEIEDVHATEKEKDLYYYAQIRRVIGDTEYFGQVEDIECGKLTRERLYRIRYEDGDMEHSNETQVKECAVGDVAFWRLRAEMAKKNLDWDIIVKLRNAVFPGLYDEDVSAEKGEPEGADASVGDTPDVKRPAGWAEEKRCEDGEGQMAETKLVRRVDNTVTATEIQKCGDESEAASEQKRAEAKVETIRGTNEFRMDFERKMSEKDVEMKRQAEDFRDTGVRMVEAVGTRLEEARKEIEQRMADYGAEYKQKVEEVMAVLLQKKNELQRDFERKVSEKKLEREKRHKVEDGDDEEEDEWEPLAEGYPAHEGGCYGRRSAYPDLLNIWEAKGAAYQMDLAEEEEEIEDLLDAMGDSLGNEKGLRVHGLAHFLGKEWEDARKKATEARAVFKDLGKKDLGTGVRRVTAVWRLMKGKMKKAAPLAEEVREVCKGMEKKKRTEAVAVFSACYARCEAKSAKNVPKIAKEEETERFQKDGDKLEEAIAQEAMTMPHLATDAPEKTVETIESARMIAEEEEEGKGVLAFDKEMEPYYMEHAKRESEGKEYEDGDMEYASEEWIKVMKIAKEGTERFQKDGDKRQQLGELEKEVVEKKMELESGCTGADVDRICKMVEMAVRSVQRCLLG